MKEEKGEKLAFTSRKKQWLHLTFKVQLSENEFSSLIYYSSSLEGKSCFLTTAFHWVLKVELYQRFNSLKC